jgi:hypothetical protein
LIREKKPIIYYFLKPETRRKQNEQLQMKAAEKQGTNTTKQNGGHEWGPHRLRRGQQEEEDAAALKLGAGEPGLFNQINVTLTLNVEFNNAGCLLISEVKFLLEHRDDTRDAPDNA